MLLGLCGVVMVIKVKLYGPGLLGDWWLVGGVSVLVGSWVLPVGLACNWKFVQTGLWEGRGGRDGGWV